MNCSVSAYRSFFREEFNNPYYSITKTSLATRLQSLLNSQIFSRITSGRSTANLEQFSRQGKIVLFNLSKGALGEEVSETL